MRPERDEPQNPEAMLLRVIRVAEILVQVQDAFRQTAFENDQEPIRVPVRTDAAPVQKTQN